MKKILMVFLLMVALTTVVAATEVDDFFTSLDTLQVNVSALEDDVEDLEDAILDKIALYEAGDLSITFDEELVEYDLLEGALDDLEDELDDLEDDFEDLEDDDLFTLDEIRAAEDDLNEVSADLRDVRYSVNCFPTMIEEYSSVCLEIIPLYSLEDEFDYYEDELEEVEEDLDDVRDDYLDELYVLDEEDPFFEALLEELEDIADKLDDIEDGMDDLKDDFDDLEDDGLVELAGDESPIHEGDFLHFDDDYSVLLNELGCLQHMVNNHISNCHELEYSDRIEELEERITVIEEEVEEQGRLIDLIMDKLRALWDLVHP